MFSVKFTEIYIKKIPKRIFQKILYVRGQKKHGGGKKNCGVV
jgi:hypothetical protein